MESISRGVLDAPLSRGMTSSEGDGHGDHERHRCDDVEDRAPTEGGLRQTPVSGLGICAITITAIARLIMAPTRSRLPCRWRRRALAECGNMAVSERGHSVFGMR
jgi:hypothetical protein